MTTTLHHAEVAAPPPTPDGPLLPLVGGELPVPLVTGGSVRYANLDLAASAPALPAVAGRVAELLPLYSSVHRGAGYASAVSTAAYEDARNAIGRFVGARPDDVVIITRNTTDALNLLASAAPGPAVLLDVEHHANLLPWTARGGRVVPARKTLADTLADLDADLARRPAALLAVTGASNVTGELLPLPELADIAHRHGARLAVDGAQLVPHRAVDLAATGVDYLAFSGHKLYAPYGAGALVGRRDWLDVAPPHLAGGGAVREVRLDGTSYAEAPARHEAGTPNVLGAVALGAACRTLAALAPGALAAHESALLHRLLDGLTGVDGVTLLRMWPDAARVGVVGFAVEGVPAELVAQYLSAEHGIGVRDGRFCAHPLLARLRPGGTAVRASLGVGSRGEDVDRLVGALHRLRRSGPGWTYAGPRFVPVPDPRPLPDWLPAAAGPSSPCGP